MWPTPAVEVRVRMAMQAAAVMPMAGTVVVVVSASLVVDPHFGLLSGAVVLGWTQLVGL